MAGPGLLAALLDARCWAVALVALCVQAALRRRFARGGPFLRDPGFAAHQLVCLPLLLPVVLVGCLAWLRAPGRAELGPAERLYGPDWGGRATAQLSVAVGLWDLPTYLAEPSLRTPVMLAHHGVALALQVLMVGAGLLQHYGGFFFGVTELSTLPLLVVDLLHPKHFPELAERNEALSLAVRGCFALSFLAVRVLYWPFVLAGLWADLSWELQAASGPAPALLLWAILGGSAFLTALQFYWGFLILQQVMKMLFPKPAIHGEGAHA